MSRVGFELYLQGQEQNKKWQDLGKVSAVSGIACRVQESPLVPSLLPHSTDHSSGRINRNAETRGAYLKFRRRLSFLIHHLCVKNNIVYRHKKLIVEFKSQHHLIQPTPKHTKGTKNKITDYGDWHLHDLSSCGLELSQVKLFGSRM